MIKLLKILGWITGILIILLVPLALISRSWFSVIPLLLLLFLLLPPLVKLLKVKLGIPIPIWLHSIFIPILGVSFLMLLFINIGNSSSIYKNSDIQNELMKAYDEKMQDWPVEYKIRILNTEIGNVHIIESGSQNLNSLLLLHTSTFPSWMWKQNIESLSKSFHVYAIDLIGDAGKSVLYDVNNYPTNGEQIAKFYVELIDSLGLEKPSIIGAGRGGFIALNMAIHFPDRIDRLILSSPIGFGTSPETISKMLMVTLFPTQSVKDDVFNWMLGNNEFVKEEMSNWFNLIIDGVIPRVAKPKTFEDDELSKINCQTLMILPEDDEFIGKPEVIKIKAKPLKKVVYKEVKSAHLINVEKPAIFNNLVLGFLNKE